MPQALAENRPSRNPFDQIRRPINTAQDHLVAGATGGIATAIFTSPLDVLRTRLQGDFYRSVRTPTTQLVRQRLGLPFLETFRILGSIHRLEGWRGFFRGLGPGLTGVVPATAIKFYTYGNCKRHVPELLQCDPNAVIVPVISAATAGIVTATATNPIWLVKTRLQLDRSRLEGAGSRLEPQYKNGLDCARQVVRQEGVRSLFRGVSASYLGAVETTLHLAMYEQLKALMARRDRETKQDWETSAGASAAAGVSKFIASLIAYPHEVIRTRLRQAPSADGRKYLGLVQCFRLVWREEGMGGLYGGLTPHLMRSIPSAIITLGVYEFVLEAFRKEV